MKAIFLVRTKEKMNSVYIKEEVETHLQELLPIETYTKDEIIKSKDLFLDVKYIFSTWYMPTFTDAEVKAYFPSLKAVFYAAGTVKYFAEPFLRNSVKVYSAASVNGVAVAEFTTAQILLANKGYFQAQKECKKPFFKFSYYNARKFVYAKAGNYKAKIGLIGAGAVGSKVVELLKSYKLDIYICDPHVSEERINRMGAKRVDLSELFKICDVISNHLPDIPETKGILNYSLFSTMKPMATFINTGRGAQVVEKDLLRALKNEPNRCALLDVYSHEPLWPWSPLNWRKNVFLTPHIAGSTSHEEQRMAEYMYEAYYDCAAGKQNACEVTIEMLARMA